MAFIPAGPPPPAALLGLSAGRGWAAQHQWGTGVGGRHHVLSGTHRQALLMAAAAQTLMHAHAHGDKYTQSMRTHLLWISELTHT